MYLRPGKFFRNQILLDCLGRWRNQSCQIFFQSVHSDVLWQGVKLCHFQCKTMGGHYNCCTTVQLWCIGKARPRAPIRTRLISPERLTGASLCTCQLKWSCPYVRPSICSPTSIEKRFGMGHNALKWMTTTSYFKGCTQTFRAHNRDWDPHTLRFRVPRGLFAGLQTFVCFKKDIHQVVTFS